jgi:hypothetical protein
MPAAPSAEQAGPPMCEPTDFKIYFERGDARITKPAERTLDVVTSHMRGCDIISVKLQAETATIANEKDRRIAGERGARILSALRDRGISSDTVLVTAQGSPLEPASAAPDHLTVVVHAAPPSVSARRRAPGETDA